MRTLVTEQPGIVAHLVGWAGTFAILGSYALLSLDIFDNNSITYHIIVLLGSVSLIYITLLQKAYQPLVINVVFGTLSVIALMRISLFG